MRSDGFALVPSPLRWRLRAAPVAELSREQRRELVEAWLRIAPSWSDRAIASECGVSHQTVGRLRDRLDHSQNSGNGAALRMVDTNSAVGGEGADVGRTYPLLAMVLSTVEQEQASRWVPRQGKASPTLPTDPHARSVILRRRALHVERIERRHNMLTNSERLDRLERALVLRTGINLEHFGAGPTATSPVVALVPDDDVQVVDEPQRAA